MLQTSLLISQTVASLEEYLKFEETATDKHEYHNGKLHKMSGGAANHSTITLNIASFLKYYMKGKKIKVFNNDMRVYSKILDEAFYPDVSMCTEPIDFPNPKSKTLYSNPLVLVEVLSKSTSNYDFTTKFDQYKTLSSFREYVLVDQYEKLVQVRTLIDVERDLWDIRLYREEDEKVVLKSLECEIPFSDIYEDVEFEGK
jgi:Uma2 family endonuclease